MLSLSIRKIHMHIKNRVLSLNSLYKRVSFPSSFRLRGSMAAEGCLVLPVFLFFMVTLLYSLEMVRFQSDVYEAMHQSGSEAGVLAYEEALSKSDAAWKVEQDIQQQLEKQKLPYLCVNGGKNGVSVETKPDDFGTGNFKIEVSYEIKPLIGWLQAGELAVKDSILVHGFVGYRGENTDEAMPGQEPYVYITSAGTKYHVSEDCTYLRVQIQAVKAEDRETLRNASGEIYYACEVCKPQGEGLCYLTKWGNKYHGKSDCSALKRTVYLVPLSQVGERTVCRKCG